MTELSRMVINIVVFRRYDRYNLDIFFLNLKLNQN